MKLKQNTPLKSNKCNQFNHLWNTAINSTDTNNINHLTLKKSKLFLHDNIIFCHKLQYHRGYNMWNGCLTLVMATIWVEIMYQIFFWYSVDIENIPCSYIHTSSSLNQCFLKLLSIVWFSVSAQICRTTDFILASIKSNNSL